MLLRSPILIGVLFTFVFTPAATKSIVRRGLQAPGRPLILAHRGASGMFPEHTALAYAMAVEQGADYVECDVTVTKDLQLVCSHDPWLSIDSNVANNSMGGPEHPDFSDRLTTYTMNDDDDDFDWVDKGDITDYFTFDFTLEELLTLRRFQPLSYRDPSYNWQYQFVPFRDYLSLSRELGFGIYPEVKLGSATNKILQSRGVNETLESMILQVLAEFDYLTSDDPCFVQCFEQTSLRMIKESGSTLKQIFLLNKVSRTTDEDLDNYASLGVYGLGLDKNILVTKDANSNHINVTNQELVDKVHALGMQVHGWTYRNEYQYLYFDYGQDPHAEYAVHVDMGVDAMFTDFPGSLRSFLDMREKMGGHNKEINK